MGDKLIYIDEKITNPFLVNVAFVFSFLSTFFFSLHQSFFPRCAILS